MDSELQQSITKFLEKREDVTLAIIYGSAAEQRQNPESDLDLAVAGDQPLDAQSKMELIEEFALLVGRPIDLVDLQETHGTLLKQILTKGKVIYKEDVVLYGEIIKRMLFHEADFMPYYNRILKERRERWINN